MIRPDWLDILSNAAELAYVAKREQTKKFWDNVSRQKLEIYFEMKPGSDNLEPASPRGSGGVAGLWNVYFITHNLRCVVTFDNFDCFYQNYCDATLQDKSFFWNLALFHLLLLVCLLYNFSTFVDSVYLICNNATDGDLNCSEGGLDHFPIKQGNCSTFSRNA